MPHKPEEKPPKVGGPGTQSTGAAFAGRMSCLSALARKFRKRMPSQVLLSLLAFALSFLKQANDLTRAVRQYDDGLALSFGCFLSFAVHGF